MSNNGMHPTADTLLLIYTESLVAAGDARVRRSAFCNDMRITYDDEANASYVYFTHIDPGGVAETIPFHEMDVDLDEAEQIVTLRLAESEECVFQKRLRYALQHPNVSYDESGGSLVVTFGDDPKPTRSISWEANIDLDAEGQILGLEILFADPDYGPDDGRERLYAVGKLKHIAKYIAPFDELR